MENLTGLSSLSYTMVATSGRLFCSWSSRGPCFVGRPVYLREVGRPCVPRGTQTA